MDKATLEALRNYRPEDKAALATIIRSKGSTPRGIGTSFLIYADGRTVGTIGGGCAEAEVKQGALTAIDYNEVKIHHVDLTGDVAEDEGMVCGGIMDVIIEPIQDPGLFQEMESYLAENKNIYSCLVVGGAERENVGKRAIYDREGNFISGTQIIERLKAEWLAAEPMLVNLDTSAGTMEVFIQPVTPPNSLLILGAGYIAQALVASAGELDFEITVVDDRADFANPAKLPGARVICNKFTKALENYPVTENTYIVIVTRGHRYDAECLRQVISSPAAYIGMIGSRRRTRLLLRQLEEEGYPREELAKVKTPIGLDIGGETPGEIAISILAEIILKKRKGTLLLENSTEKLNT
ncbi:MAG: XdhC family protein [Clostridia bacterium]|jgi:xanthine dehydrogenase accessory factor|nr:XdhC family protein [Clostridia bacterium]